VLPAEFCRALRFANANRWSSWFSTFTPFLTRQSGWGKHLSVLRRFGHLLLIVAFLAAVGGHWMILQTFAWSTMLVENLQTASLSKAVERTFDGEHPCKLCKRIAEDKQSEKQSEFPQLVVKKLDFAADTCRFSFVAPSDFRLLGASSPTANSFRPTPPVPPPRSSIA